MNQPKSSFFILLISCIMCFPVFASESDLKKQALTQLTANNFIHAKFKQINLTDQTKQNGEIFISKPSNLKISYEKPSFSLLIKNNKVIYQDYELETTSFHDLSDHPLVGLLLANQTEINEDLFQIKVTKFHNETIGLVFKDNNSAESIEVLLDGNLIQKIIRKINNIAISEMTLYDHVTKEKPSQKDLQAIFAIKKFEKRKF